MDSQIDGCKLPRRLENPIDDRIMVAIDPWLAQLHAFHVTPNMVTVASMSAAALSLFLFWKARPILSSIAWIVSYVLDCFDGMLARRYDQETALGSCLDHASDVIAFVGLMWLVVARMRGKASWPILVEVILLAGSYYHLQCQEKGTRHMAFDGIDGSHCLDKAHLEWSRWLGTGTLTAWHVFLIMYYSRS